MVYCPECGSEISSEDIFCGNCGIALTPIVPVGESFKDAPISEDEARADEDFDAAQDNPFAEHKENIAPADNFPPATENKSAIETAQDEPAPTEKSSESFGQDSENQAVQAEPVELPPLAPETENKPLEINSSESFDWEVEQIATVSKSEISAAQNVEKQNFPLENAATPNADSAPPSNSEPANNEINSDRQDFAGFDKIIEEKAPASKEFDSSGNQAPKSSSDSTEADFQETIPYTPSDIADQKVFAAKISEEKPLEEFAPTKLAPDDAERFAVGENAVPIEPPDLPVGSSKHDSLEPTLVSVQIYDPKERPEEVEPPTLLNSPEDVKAIVEQAKSEQAQDIRSYTSPNMGIGETDGKGKAKLKPLDEGTVLNNRYEVVRKIGGGGMGAVYLASDRNLGGISRAVKEMVQSYIEDAQQEKAVNDFRRESMLLTSLEHPSIPTIYDYFFDDKEARFYLVMKYIAGGDLAARLRSASEGKIDEASVTEWGIQLADVLDYLHNRQPPIVYRDLKPSNIMIDGNTGKVMLIDFGIARWVNKEERGVTAVGTMGYAPPELFSGNVEPRSDIYSLGSTMFHLLTGADPQSNPLLIFDFQKNPRPRQINSQLTDQMEQILMRMVEYSAEKRFASAAELRDALAIHLDNLKRGNVTKGVSGNPKTAAQLVFCGFCGQKILAADVFCPFCGAQQAGAKAVGAAASPPSTRATAKLVVIGTNELSSPVFKLEKDENLVGRRDPLSNIFPEVDLSKFDPQTKISRRHARIWRERESFMVEDLGSSNGTMVIAKNSESRKLGKKQPHILTSGDKIKIGDTTLYFVCE